MWWLAFWALGAVVWVAWGLVMYWPRPHSEEQGRRGPLLMVMVRDRAEVVEWFLRGLFRLLAWGPIPTGWDLVICAEGSSDETAVIAGKLLRGSGIPFLTLDRPGGGTEPGGGPEPAEGRRVLVLRLVQGVNAGSLLAQARWFLAGHQQDPGVSCRIT